jgi:hypothetical protein
MKFNSDGWRFVESAHLLRRNQLHETSTTIRIYSYLHNGRGNFLESYAYGNIFTQDGCWTVNENESISGVLFI